MERFDRFHPPDGGEERQKGWCPCETGDALFAHAAFGNTYSTGVPEEQSESTDGARVSLAVLSANPTTGGAQLGIDLPTRSDVVVEVFNIAGRLVRTLWDAPLQSGQHDILWDGRDARTAGILAGASHGDHLPGAHAPPG